VASLTAHYKENHSDQTERILKFRTIADELTDMLVPAQYVLPQFEFRTSSGLTLRAWQEDTIIDQNMTIIEED